MAQERPRLSTAAAWVAMIAIGLGWGTTQLLSKVIVSGGHHPVGITLTGTILGAVIVSAVLIGTGRRLPLRRRDLIFYMVCGLLGTALPNSVSYFAYQELSVGVISILMALVPMTTLLGALVLGLERLQWVRMAGLTLGAGAVLLLVVPKASLPDPDQAIWITLPVITVLAYSAENLYIASARRTDLDPLQVLCGLFWGALIWLLPVAAGMNAWMGLGRFDVSEWALIATTFLHIGAYGGFVWLIGRAGPVFAAQVGYVVTLTGVFLGMAVLGEGHSGWVWLSLIVMLTGLTLVQPR